MHLYVCATERSINRHLYESICSSTRASPPACACVKTAVHDGSRACTCVCLCVAGLQDCVEGVCNKCARARGPERYITGGGRAEKVQRGGKGGREKDRLVRKKKWGEGGLVSPGSCYVSHYVSHGHRQHASRQNKRVSLAWHGSYFPILGAGSERGQAAGWGAGGIVGSGLASKTQKAQGSSTS